MQIGSFAHSPMRIEYVLRLQCGHASVTSVIYDTVKQNQNLQVQLSIVKFTDLKEQVSSEDLGLRYFMSGTGRPVSEVSTWTRHYIGQIRSLLGNN